MKNLLTLLILSFVLSGCAAAVVGGAGAGGYAVGKDERTVGRITDDAVITSKVKTALLRNSNVSGLAINVDTNEGVVFLYGSVKNNQAKQTAISLAQSVKGVVKVVPKLTVTK